jgi:hypothetical protein
MLWKMPRRWRKKDLKKIGRKRTFKKNLRIQIRMKKGLEIR